MKKITLFFSCVLLIFVSTTTLVVSRRCQSSQQALLLQFKDTLVFNYTVPEYLSRWNKTTDCCTWNGVGCDFAGHVVNLSLSFESITSGFDESSSLFNLKYLQLLDLSFNIFNVEIPSRLGNLTNLKYLNLRRSNFTGPIPASIANLTQLEQLDLSYNQLSGPIPQFYQLKSLSHLVLRNNKLVGDISSTSLEQLPNLNHLDLSSNFFNGSIPTSVFRRPHTSNSLSWPLEFVDLSNNRFEGPIPESIFELGSLKEQVHLDMFGMLGNLTYLDLSYDSLTVNQSSNFTDLPCNLTSFRSTSCNINGILPNIGRKLPELDLSNNRISGDIPAWVWKLDALNLSHNSLIGFQRSDLISVPRIVDLHSNRLEGNIPRQLYYVRKYLDISDNNFNSSIPHDIGDALGSFVFFSASKNKLTGVIPNSICNSLKTYQNRILDLSNNNLRGRIPSCLFHSYNYLTDLNLRNNRFFGTIPDRFTPQCLFQTLSLSGNLLQGTVPKSLANCQSLEVLDIGNNRFQDGFPCWLKNISNLRILDLRSNKFHGDTSCIENNSWSLLQILDLSFNNFSGVLPKKALKLWKAMTREEYQSETEILGQDKQYNYGLHIIMKGLEVELVKILTIFTYIDMSSNNFQGPIPEQIGFLKSLHLLNLSRNSLTGSIPTSIGKMMQLESLDLSANNLQGHLPAELASLNFLAVLNLSYNEFVGRIPIGTQLQSFSSSSFEGNDGLCGAPLKDCSNPTHQSHQTPKVDLESSIFDWQMALFIGVGFGIGFLAAVGPLIFSDQVNLWYDIFIYKLLHLFRKYNKFK